MSLAPHAIIRREQCPHPDIFCRGDPLISIVGFERSPRSRFSRRKPPTSLSATPCNQRDPRSP